MAKISWTTEFSKQPNIISHTRAHKRKQELQLDLLHFISHGQAVVSPHTALTHYRWSKEQHTPHTRDKTPPGLSSPTSSVFRTLPPDPLAAQRWPQHHASHQDRCVLMGSAAFLQQSIWEMAEMVLIVVDQRAPELDPIRESLQEHTE